MSDYIRSPDPIVERRGDRYVCCYCGSENLRASTWRDFREWEECQDCGASWEEDWEWVGF